MRTAIARLVCRVKGHREGPRTDGAPLGSRSPYRNDYIYVYCGRCRTELRRYRDW